MFPMARSARSRFARKRSVPPTVRLGVERLEDRALMAVLAADLTAFRPLTSQINYENFAISEEFETQEKKGAGIRVNGDDDDGNGQRDFADAGPLAATDNDLARVDIQGFGTQLNLSWSGALAVWTTNTKNASLARGDVVTPGQQVWVEYTSESHTSGANTQMTLTASESFETTVTDTVVFHSFQSVVIVIGGNTQHPGQVPQPGIYQIGKELYRSGYDVHLFTHDQIASTGHGAAFDGVHSAVQSRNVDFVGIFGYSWGGGATYELSVGLNAAPDLAGKYKLKYTGYVEGIRHGSVSSETRMPAASQFHDNVYQRRDWLLKGNAVNNSKASNLNVNTTTWGKLLDHYGIDDHVEVYKRLVANAGKKLDLA